jgi:2,3-bisphosphoglycerate-independent phosphoglycerate mutase
MPGPIKKLPRRPVILIILDGFGSNPAKANPMVHMITTAATAPRAGP